MESENEPGSSQEEATQSESVDASGQDDQAQGVKEPADVFESFWDPSGPERTEPPVSKSVPESKGPQEWMPFASTPERDLLQDSLESSAVPEPEPAPGEPEQEQGSPEPMATRSPSWLSASPATTNETKIAPVPDIKPEAEIASGQQADATVAVQPAALPFEFPLAVPPTRPSVDVLPAERSTGWTVPVREPARFGSLRSKQTIKHVDPWTMLKVSVTFYLALMITVVLFFMILFWVAQGAGVVRNIDKLVQLAWPDFHFKGSVLFRILLVIGVVQVIVMSMMTLVAAFVYNLVADITGGVEMTVSTRDI
ncbi:MAG: DUF3566 domain-containing protein [Actinobacteria bacterium]|nr:DUF3566 domain-containing protein [Actinomycetota bacterium]